MSELSAGLYQPLAYADRLQARTRDAIDLAVVHCTELPDLPTAREYGQRIHYPQSQTGNSGHFYIDRDGSVQQWVPLERVAHHVRGHNAHSIGIELVNRGRFPHWLHVAHQTMQEAYADAQIDALIALLAHLRRQLPQLRHIAGHDDLDTDEVPAADDPQRAVRRKCDPGPLFPWPRVLAAVPLQRIAASAGAS